MQKIIGLLFLLFVTMACTSKQMTQINVLDSNLQITENAIISSFVARADSSINFKRLNEHYLQYPDRWKLAFDYLAALNPDSLTMGRTDLSDDVFVAISEYNTKVMQDTKFESHQTYIDIQYVIAGSELIALSRDTTMFVTQSYDSINDITFYAPSTKEMLLSANPKTFFIFFPEDIHRPCINDGNFTKVKKIVVKLKVK